jgi:lipoxygenase homology domain-containing protein 1
VVRVKTGDKGSAGTDSDVFVTLFGEKGDTGERELARSEHINKFERNQVRVLYSASFKFTFKFNIFHNSTCLTRRTRVLRRTRSRSRRSRSAR